MAAIFQIRRGSGSVSLVDGELYLHKSSGSIQFSLGDGNPILLARLDQINSGSLNLSGDVTASNAVFTGDVAISGNLYLGNQITDNISALGQFTTNLVPNPNNSIDVGTPTAVWRTMYATTFSGSFDGTINGLGNPAVFSASVDNRLDQLEVFSGSQEAKDVIISAYTASMNSFTASVDGHIADINAKTGSFENKFATLQTYTASVDAHISNVNSFTASQEEKDVIIGAYTASMNTFTQSVNGHISDINAYTQSLRDAIDVTGGNTRILGNLIVDGTQTSLNTTNTYIEDKLLTLSSGSTTSITSDGSGFEIAGANVSMSWEHNNTRFGINTNLGIEGSISSSTVVGLNGASVEVYSTSVDSRLTNLESKSASVDNSISLLNQFTESQDSKNSTLATYTASVDSDLASIHITTASLNTFTASIAGTNDFTESVKHRLDNLESTSASFSSSIEQINLKTGSFESKFTTIGSVTSSLNNFTSSQEEKNTTLQNVTASLNLATASFNSWTGSGFFTAYSTSVDNLLDGLRYDLDLLTPAGLSAAFDNLNNFTSSQEEKNTTLQNVTASLNLAVSNINSFTASNNIAELNSYTQSLKGAITVSGTDVSLAGNLTVLGTTTIIDSTTLNIKDNIIQLNGAGSSNAGLVVRDATGETTTSGSLLWDTTNDYWIAGPLGAESKLLRAGGDNVVSSSTQIPSLLPAGIVSGAAQIPPLLPEGVVSSSSQISGISNSQLLTPSLQIAGTIVQLGSIVTTDQIRAAIGTVVTGSSQITYSGISSIPAGIVSSSSQIIGVTNSQLINSNITIAGTSVALGGAVTADQIRTAIGTVVTGSSQITLSSTTGGGTTSNVQFGSLGIGITPTNVSGEIVASGDIVAFASSDIRLKENIQPIQNALEKVESISGNTYDWKEGFEEIHSHKGNDIGVIAQEIEEILPQIVTNRDNGYKAVQYEKIVPLLIEAIKELSAKVKQLENK